ncbi:MAG: tetratricopeptide (TPR) repeat protein, partial [Planctomycetota bacterium]
EVVLLEENRVPTDRNFDYCLRVTLAVEGSEGTLTIGTEVFDNGSGAGSKKYEDVCKQVDDDEWALQENLVRAAVRTIRKRLTTTSTPQRTPTKRKVEEAQALARYAHDVLHRSTNRHLMAAIGSFRRALDNDPYCALAYAGLAEAMVRKFLYWDGDPSFLEEAREAADKALALDSSCAEAHTALGFANHLAGYREDALREYRAAIQLDNREWLAHRLEGALLAREGNFKHASPLLTRAIGLRATHIDSYDHLYTVLLRLDRYEEAIEVADRGIAAGKKHLKQVPDDQSARLHVAMLQARLGLQDDARDQVTEARKRAPKDGYTAFHSACVFALMGEPTEALELLQLAQARGYYIKTELVRNTDLDLLRGLPEFQELAS